MTDETDNILNGFLILSGFLFLAWLCFLPIVIANDTNRTLEKTIQHECGDVK